MKTKNNEPKRPPNWTQQVKSGNVQKLKEFLRWSSCFFGEKTLENCLRGCNGKMATITQSVLYFMLCIEDACFALPEGKNNCLTRKQKRKAVSDPLP